MISSLFAHGTLQTRVFRSRPPLAWRLRNTLRWGFLRGWLAWHLAPILARLLGFAAITSRLQAVLIHPNGTGINYGTLGYRVITDAGVAALVDDWQAGSPRMYNVMHFHGCGTGTEVEAAGETALKTECTTALNPDSTRATGTDTQPSANVFQSVGTLTFDNTAAVIEHGILSQAATGGGTLWDRTEFSAINVVSGDSIQFTYQCTISSGG